MKRKNKPKEPTWKIAGCVWCDAIMLEFDGDKESYHEMLREHVIHDCKFHPMRKLERKLKRLEKKR